MNKSYLLAVLILLIALLWIGSGYLVPADTGAEQLEQEEVQSPDPEDEIMKVRVMNSQAQDYGRSIKVNGRSHASRNVTLKSETAGQVVEILVDEGEQVAEAAEIIKIDIRERAERVNEARELVNQKQIEYDAAQKLKKQGYSSDVRLAQTRSELESAKASLTQAEIALEKTTISAPFDGVLGERVVDIGDYIRVGDPVISIVDLDPLEVTVFVNEKEVIQIHKGDDAQIKFANGKTATGEVTFISPAADETSRTFHVDIAIDNAGNALPAGLTAEASIHVEEQKAHKISPAILTLNDGGDVGLKIVNADNEVEFVHANLVADEADAMWVGGLPDEVKIITVGQDFVAVGQKVNPVVAGE